jgi:hypothetical protein
MGDHVTLLAKGGIYADLYWQRQLEEELEQENEAITKFQAPISK